VIEKGRVVAIEREKLTSRSQRREGAEPDGGKAMTKHRKKSKGVSRLGEKRFFQRGLLGKELGVSVWGGGGKG